MATKSYKKVLEDVLEMIKNDSGSDLGCLLRVESFIQDALGYGMNKPLTPRDRVTCPCCKGTGQSSDGDFHNCARCDGRGTIRQRKN